MNHAIRFLTFLFLFGALFQFGAAAEIGEVVFRESFDAETLPEGWTASDSRFVSVHDKALRVELPSEGEDKFASATKQLPVETLRGTRLRITARVKAENVVKPPNSWNGVKVMLVLDGPDGKRWLQQNNVHGTFNGKTLRFNAAIPLDATSAQLVLGLENTTGRVWISDVEIKVIGKRRTLPTQRDDSPTSVYKGHDLPRLRGAMISPGQFGPEDIKVLAGDWKANHVRWQLIWSGFPNGPADSATVEQFDAWIEEQCKLLDAMLPECKKYGVRVCLDLHTPPGGRLPREEGSAMRLFREKKFQDAFVAVWKRLAERYKDAEMIWGYDLLNEPVEGEIADEDGILDWRELALKTAKAVREIDPDRAIVIEPAPWGDPAALEWFEPFDPQEVPNVVYSVHMYIPHAFTHQGVYESPVGLVYPGEVGGKQWNKDELRKALKAPIEFARDYGVSIYLGEFSAIRWAPDDSACRYLKDCIEIFEEEDWDWAYHAFREWDGWSVEHGSEKEDRKRTETPTDRQLLLRSWFEKNER